MSTAIRYGHDGHEPYAIEASERCHDYLVWRGEEWLKLQRSCPIVFSEKGICTEKCDVIGWENPPNPSSIVIECKTSILDFSHDQRKPHRMYPQLGLGRERWYLAPAYLLTHLAQNERFWPAGWGLLEVDQYGIVEPVVPAVPFDTGVTHALEREILIRELAARMRKEAVQ